VLILAALAIAPAAYADDGEREAEAERLYADGQKAAQAERWTEARDRFREAFALTPHAQIAVQLGRAELSLGESASAAEHLAFFLRTATDASASDRQTVQAMLDRARAKVAAVEVTVEPSGAEVRVEGREVGTAPLADPVFVEPGTRDVEAFGRGGSARATIEAAAGKTYRVGFVVSGGGAGLMRVDPSLRWGVTIGGSAATLVTLGIGVGLGAAAMGARYGEQESLQRGAIACTVIGAALGVGTAVFATLTVPGEGPAGKKVSAGPMVMAGGGGVVVGAVW
jgi:hypothetical protein